MDNVGRAAQAQRIGHRLVDPLEESVRHRGVCIDKNQNLAVRDSRTRVSNPGNVMDRLTNDSCPRCTCDLSRPVSARIIHNDEFDATPGLRGSPLEAPERLR